MSEREPLSQPQLSKPQLSVVLLACGGYGLIERTVEHLRRQTLARRIELLVMSPRPAQVRIPEPVARDFHSVRVVEAEAQRRVCAIRAAGIREAQAPYVAMAEDHCYANRTWAQTLLAAHEDGAEVVGPAMDNANPQTPTSWAAYLIAYAPWTGEGETQTMRFLPGHNTSYRRQTMVEFGDRLDLLMGAELVAHREIHDRGGKVIWVPAARCRHVNLTQPIALAQTMYHHSRVFGSLRFGEQARAKRWFYAAASPLVPPLRVYRAWPQIRRRAPDGVSKGRALGSFALAALTSAAGEAMGLMFGAGHSPENDWKVELDRKSILRSADAPLVLGTTAAGENEPDMPAGQSPVRVGVIGCGALVRGVHLPLLRRDGRARITALADPDDSALAEAANQASQARTYADPTALIEDQHVDAVLIATPTATHGDLATQAFEAGKAVYLEKPIAGSLDEGRRILDAWQHAGTVGMVGFNYRHHPGYQAMRKAIMNGEIGHVHSVRTTFSAPAPEAGWRHDRQAGGGVLLELGSHEIDLVHFVLEQTIESVDAHITDHAHPGDTVCLHGRTTAGVEVQGLFSHAGVCEAMLEVYGDQGKLWVDRYGGLGLERQGVQAVGSLGRTLQGLIQWRGIGYHLRRSRSPWGQPSFANNLGRFIEACQSSHPRRPHRTPVHGEPTLFDGYRSLAVIATAEASARNARKHNVDHCRCSRASPTPTTS